MPIKNEYVLSLEEKIFKLEEELTKLKSNYIIRIPTLTDDFYDRDYVLLNAVFTIFQEYVEKEIDGKFAYHNLKDAQTSDEEKLFIEENKDTDKLQELYKWWKSNLKDGIVDDHNKYDSNTEKLIELIKLRKYFWT